MRKWIRFGEQVNRLVYALAGAKYSGGVESANRLVAERTNYSEVSVRMMRQGRYRPQTDSFLEIMVQLGKEEAELEYEWAKKLLLSGQHPSPEKVLKNIYGDKPIQSVSVVTKMVISPIFFFIARSTAAFAGTILLLAIWVYFFSLSYPPPHEPRLLMETLWGLSIGLGLALGLIVFDLYRAGGDFAKASLLYRYLVLPFGGLLGAGFWRFSSFLFIHVQSRATIQSGATETFMFGLSYAAGLIVVIASLVTYKQEKSLRRFQWISFSFMALFGGLITLFGFLLPCSHPSFSNQRDIDLFVGLVLRLGMAIIAGFCFPPLRLPNFNVPNRFRWIPWYSLPSEK